MLLSAKVLAGVASAVGGLFTVLATWLSNNARERTSTLEEWRQLTERQQAEVERLQKLLDECQWRVAELARGNHDGG